MTEFKIVEYPGTTYYFLQHNIRIKHLKNVHVYQLWGPDHDIISYHASEEEALLYWFSLGGSPWETLQRK